MLKPAAPERDFDLPLESELLDARRQALFGDGFGEQRRWALALSGGGIRSATFSLGVLQAIAEAPPPDDIPQGGISAVGGGRFQASLLSRFDYLSTVSGGGYTGAFMCSLFQPGRLRDGSTTAQAAADDAAAVLAGGPPGRMAPTSYDDKTVLGAPLAWLRENGRYLVPTGVGDAVYAAALGIRGWIALHVVIGILLVFLLALLMLGRALLPPVLHGWEHTALADALSGHGFVESIWWSPLFPLALLPLLLWAVPVGVAFWMSYRQALGVSKPLNRAVLGMLAAALALLLLAWQDSAGYHELVDLGAPLALAGPWPPRRLLWVLLAAMALLGTLYYMVFALRYPPAAGQRAKLTAQLGSALMATAALLALASIETLGQSLYLLVATDDGGTRVGPVLTPTVLVGAVVWLAKKGAAYLGKVGKAAKASLLSKVPLATLGGVAGVVIFTAIASLWSLAVVALLWAGERPDPALLHRPPQLHFLIWLVAATLALAVLLGQFPAFINLSSLQAFYSARLTRAYMGASNRQRFVGDPKGRTVAEPLAGDNLELADFYAPRSDRLPAHLTTLAPLHIINVTLNKTVDPADQLVQRDRKGQPLAVLPFGFAVDGQKMAFADPAARLVSEIELPLAVGQWIGTSGAAFSTGIGRETSLGMSLLMGAANVRLGTWWASGHGQRTPPRGLQWVSAGIGALFRTQTYLSYEFRARFFGMNRAWQYLSDGGHFENTGLYELLRAERNVGLIVASDNGADPFYRFDDLANLIRLARIDLGVEIQVVEDFETGSALDGVFGGPAAFHGAAPASAKANPFALLLKASRRDGSPPTWIVLLKPARHAQAPADIVQYAVQHDSFPQEPTTDQFFDEAQWESYRCLGHFIAGKLLEPPVFMALKQYIAG